MEVVMVSDDAKKAAEELEQTLRDENPNSDKKEIEDAIDQMTMDEARKKKKSKKRKNRKQKKYSLYPYVFGYGYHRDAEDHDYDIGGVFGDFGGGFGDFGGGGGE